jgi:hypothetical protein
VFFLSARVRPGAFLGMGVTDQQLVDRTMREGAIRALATAAKAQNADKVSARVAISRSPNGDWRVVHNERELVAGDVSVGIQVFRGETAESPSLLKRVDWAAAEVRRLVAERQGRS